MTNQSDVARGREIIERWCILAEQRLNHLTELFETGRWRRYHSEIEFLENIKEAKSAVATWRLLLNQQSARDNSTVDTSWLDRRKAVPPRRPSMLHDELRPALPRFLRVIADPRPPEPPANQPPVRTSAVEQAVAAPKADAEVWTQAIDLAVIQQRYPLLRNAL